MSYSDEVLRRVRVLERVGTLTGEGVGTGEVGTLDAGTMVRIQVRKAGDRISEARFKVFGCSAAIASASVVTEWLEGTAIDTVAAISAQRVAQALGLDAERIAVAEQVVEAARRAVTDSR